MWKSLGHFFASIAQKILSVNATVQKDAPVIEGVTGAIPVYGPLGLTIEKAGFAILGELAAFVNAGGAAAKAKLLDLGLDSNVIETAEAVGSSVMHVVANAIPAAVPSPPAPKTVA